MIDKIRKMIESDKDTKDLTLTDNELYIAYQYILQRDDNDLVGFKPKLETVPYVHITYVPTEEHLEENLNRALRRNMEIFESDIYIIDANLDDFIISDNYQKKAMTYIKRYLKDPKKYQKGMYIYGPYGVGKSFLLAGLAKELTKKHIDVVYTFMPDLIRNLRGTIGTNQLEKRINILKRCEVLILDDLGGENMTAWFRDEILLPIIHYRLNANLAVFISSNYTIADLVPKLTPSAEIGQDKALRVVRRINELTIPFMLEKRFRKD